MSMEAMESLCRAEEAAQERKAKAIAEAKRAVAKAEEEGRAALEQLAGKVAAELKARSEIAHAKAEAEVKAIIEETQNEKNALRAEAERRLDKAAEYIVERIVNG